jgi:hypothetical protein
MFRRIADYSLNDLSPLITMTWDRRISLGGEFLTIQT